MSKFAALSAAVDEPFRLILIDPLTDRPITANDGRQAYIDVLSVNSRAGQLFDKEERRITNTRMMSGRKEAVLAEDNVEQNKKKTARLTKGWLLVDPVSGNVIDAPCTEANALELYLDPGTHHLWMQVWVAASETANFIKRSPKTSLPSPSIDFVTPAN